MKKIIPIIAPCALLAGESILTGIQADETVTLTAKNQYTINGSYTIPAGKTLKIEKGTQIFVGNGGIISVEGELNSEGTFKTPVIISKKAKFWQGIELASKKSARICGLKISGATNGITVKTKIAKIEDTQISQCINGVYDGNERGKVEIINCDLSKNSGSGIVLEKMASAECKNSSFSENSEYGISAKYYPSFKIEKCIISKNKKGGMLAELYSGEISAHQCIFEKNGGFTFENKSDSQPDLSENFWGDNLTKIINEKGTEFNHKFIYDINDSKKSGRVKIAPTLPNKPAQCGPFATPDA